MVFGWWSKGREAGAEDWDQQRQNMVDVQLASRGIRDTRVLGAMLAVPRHHFTPPSMQSAAYADHPVQIGEGQTMSQPYMVGLMTELLEPGPEDRVLEVGTGAGYQAAILAELCREVITIERHESLADQARRRLEELGYDNVVVVCGDGSMGYPEGAPYDGILVTAGCPEVPVPLLEELAPGGRLVCPAGPRDVQELQKIVRQEAGFSTVHSIDCMFVPLVGEAGWH